MVLREITLHQEGLLAFCMEHNHGHELRQQTESWNSSVDKATDYRLDDPGLIPGKGRFFSSSQ
jgi:hypothetical protein